MARKGKPIYLKYLCQVFTFTYRLCRHRRRCRHHRNRIFESNLYPGHSHVYRKTHIRTVKLFYFCFHPETFRHQSFVPCIECEWYSHQTIVTRITLPVPKCVPCLYMSTSVHDANTPTHIFLPHRHLAISCIAFHLLFIYMRFFLCRLFLLGRQVGRHYWIHFYFYPFDGKNIFFSVLLSSASSANEILEMCASHIFILN